MISDTIL
jgi:hypothetical protein